MILLAVAVILLAVVIGYRFTSQSFVPTKQGKTNQTQIKNDDVSSIEKDLQDFNFSDIDKELNDIDKELVGF